MSGFTLSSFVIVFRETLEAALIVAIVLTYLIQTKANQYIKHVVGSTLAAILTSFIVAFIFDQTVGEFEGRAAEIFEGTVALLAAGVLTYMILWMHQQAAKIKTKMHEKLQLAITRQEVLSLMALPYFAVLREGAETVLFLKAAALQADGATPAFGGILGFISAVLITTSIFWLGKKIPLKPFFQYTGIFLTFIAAGLLAYGIHELEEAGFIFPIIEHIWNLNSILNEKEGIGSFLKAIFGYNGNPSLVETVAYFGYLIFLIGLLLRSGQAANRIKRDVASPSFAKN
jgi:high-affinity iron transporter